MKAARAEPNGRRALPVGSSLLLRANMLLPGVYVWITTVAYPVSLKGVGGLTRTLAVAALVCLALGAALALSRPRLGRGFGVWGFVGFCLLTWLGLGPRIGVGEIDRLRAALGSIGWALFAFGWGAMRHWGSVPEDDPRVVEGPPLAPRASLPVGASWVFGVGLSAACVVVLLAWRVTRPVHALLAHSLALTLAVWLVVTATEVAVERGVRRSAPRRRFWLVGFVVLAVAGALWALLQAGSPATPQP